MSLTNILGSVAVTVMMLSYALEARSKWFVLAFVAGSAATAVYSALVQALRDESKSDHGRVSKAPGPRAGNGDRPGGTE